MVGQYWRVKVAKDKEVHMKQKIPKNAKIPFMKVIKKIMED